jgi:peptidoglycan/LPS O-acetylase OafA/YrhL
VPTKNLLVGYAAAFAGIALIFTAILNFPGRIPRPVTYLGRISYGLYMFHHPLLWLANEHFGLYTKLRTSEQVPLYLLVLLITIGLASLSYRFFEKPILRFKERYETVRTRPA